MKEFTLFFLNLCVEKDDMVWWWKYKKGMIAMKTLGLKIESRKIACVLEYREGNYITFGDVYKTPHPSVFKFDN